MRSTTSWPQARAGLLAVVIAINLFIAVPWGPRITEDSLKKPIAADEVTGWMTLLDSLGVPMSRATFERLVVQVSGAIYTVDQAIQAPVKPLMRITGTGQAWALFSTPDSRPARLEIDGRTGDHGPFEPLYKRWDPDHAMLSSQLTFRRIRGVYDGQSNSPGRAYRNFNRWVARQIFQRRPDLDRVRIRFIRTHTVPPTSPPDPEISEEHARIVRKERL